MYCTFEALQAVELILQFWLSTVILYKLLYDTVDQDLQPIIFTISLMPPYHQQDMHWHRRVLILSNRFDSMNSTD
jgi:hypothetical protein